MLPEKIQILENLETARSENNKKRITFNAKAQSNRKNPKLDDEIKNLSLKITESEFAKKINKAENFLKMEILKMQKTS